MPDSLRRISPLDAFRAAGARTPISTTAGLLCTELPFWGHLNLRGDVEDTAFADGVRKCIGVALPAQPNTVSSNGAVTALWLGPDEWLLVTPSGKESELTSALRSTLKGLLFAVTNVTDGQTILRISGTHAFDVLREGCSLDFHPRVFRPRLCAQTTVAKAGVLIYYVDQEPTIDLIVRRSFAEYLALWLQDAALECGFTMT